MAQYPSVKKPHLKYHRERPFREVAPGMILYDMIFESNQENLNSNALDYLGRKISYKKLKEETDKLANAFYKNGIREGDLVVVGLSNSPEAIYTLLALNKIGAISKWFDLRASSEDILEYTKDSKNLVILDMLLSKVEPILDNTDIETVLVVRPGDSLPPIKKTLFNLKQKVSGSEISMPEDRRFKLFNDFYKSEDTSDSFPKASYKADKADYIVFSSGTTGKPKAIIHSNRSFESVVRSISYTDLPVKFGKRILVLLPPWIAYCLTDAMAFPLTQGAELILSPTFDPESIGEFIGKFDTSFAAPFHYRYLRDNFENLSEYKKEKIYATDAMISGGDKITAQENKEFENLFKTILVNGYGNNEGSGGLSVNSVIHNKYGSVGIPFPGMTAIAYDNDNKKELPFNETGEICFLTDTAFLGYGDKNLNTEDILKTHPDGKVWLHTGDLGYIDEDGYIFLSGRLRRVIVRQGFKISAYTIEDKISEYPNVKEVVAVEVPDEAEEHVPMAFVTLKDTENPEKDIKNILEYARKNLKEYEVPKYIKVVDELPRTDNNKYDFRKLEEIGKNYVEN